MAEGWPSLPPRNGRRDEGLGVAGRPGTPSCLKRDCCLLGHLQPVPTGGARVCSPLRDQFSAASVSWLSAFALSWAHPSVSPIPHCVPKVVTSPHSHSEPNSHYCHQSFSALFDTVYLPFTPTCQAVPSDIAPMCSMLRGDHLHAVLGPIRALSDLDWQSAWS